MFYKFGYTFQTHHLFSEDLLGGKNWRNLLAYALKFMTTAEIPGFQRHAAVPPSE